MTQFQNKSFQVAMPGNKGNWPWPDESVKPRVIKTAFGAIVADERIPLGEIHVRSGGGLLAKFINIGIEEADAIREHGGNA